MPVFCVEKDKGYTVMSNHHLRNKDLSLKAKGLLSQMLSLPEDWDYTLKGLALINREKIDAIRQATPARTGFCTSGNAVLPSSFVWTHRRWWGGCSFTKAGSDTRVFVQPKCSISSQAIDISTRDRWRSGSAAISGFECSPIRTDACLRPPYSAVYRLHKGFSPFIFRTSGVPL